MEYYAEERGGREEGREDPYPFATSWMEVENIMLSEISQLVKDKYHMISLVRGT